MFTEKLLAIYRKVGSAKTYQERRDAMMELASQYAREHDDTDPEFHEEFHQLVEDFEDAHQHLTHMALRLGRAVTTALDSESIDTEGPDVQLGNPPKGGNLSN